jgi:aquaporin Z
LVGGWALEQLWLFWVAPIVGAALAGIAYPMLAEEPAPAVQQTRAATAR